jgi:hypothetical protein
MCRIAVRCAAALETDTIISVLPAGAQDATAQLRAAVIARGRPRVAAEVLARGKPQGADEAQALSPFTVSASSRSSAQQRNARRPQTPPPAATSSVGDAAWELYGHSVSNVSVLTPQVVLKLLCTAGSPAEQPQEFDAALSQGLAALFEELRHQKVKREGMPTWLAAAIQQAELYEVAKRTGGSDLETILLGRGATDAAYLR